MKILVVDDNTAAVESFTKLFSLVGYDTAYALTAPGALQLLEENGVDVLLLDVCLPGISGISLLDALQADERFAGLPVVVITGLAEEHVEGLRLRPNVRVLIKSKAQLTDIESAFVELGLRDKMPKRGGS